MSTAFVAVVRAEEVPAGLPPEVAGAAAVHSLRNLAACTRPDETPAVLFDPVGSSEPVGPLLKTLETVGAGGPAGLVVASVRPVTDTLKQVGEGGALTGTADREHHRFVSAPIATRLGLLRAAVRRRPEARTAGEILATLVADGAIVMAGTSR